MNALHEAMRLIIDGYVMLPELITGNELQAMREGFERKCTATGKRWFDFNEISDVPELMSFILHPRLMPVIDAFINHYGYQTAFACCSGARDAHRRTNDETDKPAPPVPAADYDLRHGKLGWHDDVWGQKNPKAQFTLSPTCTCLIYLDDTFRDNGAYCAAVGSHHLTFAGADGKPRMATGELVLDHCELRAVPVKAGSVIIHQSHNWHGVLPVRSRRRMMLQSFCAREVYDFQEGHTQITPEIAARIPADRHKYFCAYQPTTRFA